MRKGQVMVFNGHGKKMEEFSSEIPELKEGEILIRNRYATICGSDLHTYCGVRQEALPTVLGHEIVGEIVAFAHGHTKLDQKGEPLKEGDMVTWSIFSSNPESYYSRHGMPQKGTGLFKYGHARIQDSDVFHGGFGEYCILKHGTSVLRIPADLPLPIAATINCAIATVAGAIRLAGDLKDKNVLITGMGLLGLTCSAMCKEAGAASVTVLDINKERLEQAGVFGADYKVMISGNENTEISEIGKGFIRKGFDAAFDMSGSPDAMELGLNNMCIGGVCIWVGAVFKTRKIEVDAEKLIRGLITIKGLHNYNYEDFIYALDFITGNWKKYAFDTVVGETFSLEEINTAFEFALKEKPLRVGVQI